MLLLMIVLENNVVDVVNWCAMLQFTKFQDMISRCTPKDCQIVYGNHFQIERNISFQMKISKDFPDCFYIPNMSHSMVPDCFVTNDTRRYISAFIVY